MFPPYPNHANQEHRPVFISCSSLSVMFNGVHHHRSQPSFNSILPQSCQFPPNLTLNAEIEMMRTVNFGAGTAAEGMFNGGKSYQEEAYYGDGCNGMGNGIRIMSLYDQKLMKKNRRTCGVELPEKVQQRMIRNRQSAARSRARRVAYNAQQKIEITQLKQENAILKKTIGLVSAMPKIGSTETKGSLKRTFSGPL